MLPTGAASGAAAHREIGESDDPLWPRSDIVLHPRCPGTGRQLVDSSLFRLERTEVCA